MPVHFLLCHPWRISCALPRALAALLKAVLTVGGAYTWYWGFEVTSSDPRRQSREDSSWPSDLGRGEGVQILQTPGSGTGVKLIDLVIHDTRQGISFWADAQDAEGLLNVGGQIDETCENCHKKYWPNY